MSTTSGFSGKRRSPISIITSSCLATASDLEASSRDLRAKPSMIEEEEASEAVEVIELETGEVIEWETGEVMELAKGGDW